MVIELYSMNTDGYILTVKAYEIEDGCNRVLVQGERVWGFIETDDTNNPKQVECRLTDTDNEVVIFG